MDNKQILEYLGECVSPMTVESISNKFNCSKQEMQRALDELMVGEKVKKITPENSNTGRVYYTVRGEKTAISDENEKTNLDNGETREKAVVDQAIVNAKDYYEELTDNYKDLTVKIEGIDKNVNGIYVNIISMMAIFVAIFALITVNANIVFTLTEENAKNVFDGIIAINIFVVICILVLLIGVRLFIINPLLKKKQR
ncbi:MAG: hypothetical protein K2O59_04605 [Lachnospiraceae bacterium]|nr:hypothetical protein [Lachnospiraceae bacterium]